MMPGQQCEAGHESTANGTGRLRAWAAALFIVVSCGVEAAWATGDPKAKGTQIPVIINLYPGSGRNEAGARAAVAEANKILKQADMKLVVVKVNNPPAGNGGDDGSGGGTAGDGDFTDAELRKVVEFGNKELKGLPNEKGIKISFGRNPVAGSTSPGVCFHGHPTCAVKNRANAADTGATIAHEIGHIMTLGVGHKVNNTVNANGGGHTPNQAGQRGNDNLMAPSNRRTGTKLTADQIAEMQKRKYTHGKCSTQFRSAFPAVKDELGFGSAPDPHGDHTLGQPDHLDIGQVFLASLNSDANLAAEIQVNGALPTNQIINARYTIGFNVDNNNGTGIAYGGYLGIDRIVRVDASGMIDDSSFALSAEIQNTVSLVVTPLPGAADYAIEHRLFDLDEDGVPANTTFFVNVPKALLNLAANHVPAVATAGVSSVIHDQTTPTENLYYDPIRWQNDATLQTFGDGVPVAGQPYQYAIAGLAPNSPYTLYLNDDVAAAGTLDGFGAANGAFNFPMSLPVHKMHFLTAQDNTGEFAYSITCPGDPPVPTVSEWGLIILALLLLTAGTIVIARRRPAPQAA